MATAVARRMGYEPTVEPNVIPFIDVLLVLLIIFMVTAPKPSTDIRVDLTPQERGAAALVPPTIIDIKATPDGGYAVFIGEEEAPLSTLGERALAHVLASDPSIIPQAAHAEARLFVRADLDVAYQNVVTVLETLQEARFRQVSIVAQQADEPPAGRG